MYGIYLENNSVFRNNIHFDSLDLHLNSKTLLLLLYQLFSVSGFHFYCMQHRILLFVVGSSLLILLRMLCFFILGIGKKLIHFYFFYSFRFSWFVFFIHCSFLLYFFIQLFYPIIGSIKSLGSGPQISISNEHRNPASIVFTEEKLKKIFPNATLLEKF